MGHPVASNDQQHMRHALTLAARGLGAVWPNPSVGCVVLSATGDLVGRGWTGRGGRPHAETVALDMAGAAARGGTVYVTLEPCAHHGMTPPCAEALVGAGVARVVVGADDPDPRVSGRGYDILEAAGIRVTRGVLGTEAGALNAGFFLRVREGRPMVTLKLATSMDGRIATSQGESKWITGDAARRMGHRLRASHDAILVGAGTATADNPSLTCRLPGLEDRSPVRVVLDGGRGLSPESVLAQTARDVPVWLITGDKMRSESERLERAGVDIIRVASAGDGGHRPALRDMLETLAERGITRLLVEGGSTVAAGFVGAGLVDRIACFRAGRLIGGDGLAALGPLGLEALGNAPAFHLVDMCRVGDDLLETWARSH